MCKVSVIMPSLNVAAYIEEAVRSVMSQTLREIEILCIDSGSDDGTVSIIEKLALEDSRIRLIHSDKRSYGYQVNEGIREAKGEYIGIVETDDYVENDMYESLYEYGRINAADIVMSDFDVFITDKEGKRFFVPYLLGKYTGTDYNRVFSSDVYLSGSIRPECHIWQAIYKRSFLINNKVLLNETPGASYQDFSFRYQTYYFAKRIIAADRSFYHYRRDNSNASTYNPKAVELNLREAQYTWKLFKDKNLTDIKIYKALAKEIAIYAFDAYLELSKWNRVSVQTESAMDSYRGIFERFEKEGYFDENLSDTVRMFVGLLLKGREHFRTYAEVMAEIEKKKINELLNSIKEYNDIIIFGAGLRGRSALIFLIQSGIEKVRLFCDNSADKQDQDLCGCNIVSPEKAVSEYVNALFLISSPSLYCEIKEQLCRYGVDEKRIICYDLPSSPFYCTNALMNSETECELKQIEELTEDKTLLLSTLPKTWIFDLDGTLVKHNGYKTDGGDSLLPGAKEYIDGLPEEDRVVILTSRTDEYKDMTVDFLKKNGIRYDEIIFNIPMGERIVINDRKPSGIDMAYSVNLDRDFFDAPEVVRKL